MAKKRNAFTKTISRSNRIAEMIGHCTECGAKLLLTPIMVVGASVGKATVFLRTVWGMLAIGAFACLLVCMGQEIVRQYGVATVYAILLGCAVFVGFVLTIRRERKTAKKRKGGSKKPLKAKP